MDNAVSLVLTGGEGSLGIKLVLWYMIPRATERTMRVLDLSSRPTYLSHD